MTTLNLTIIKNLENAQYKKVREVFYLLCKEENPVLIKRVFMQSVIRNKLTEDVISFGLFGATNSNKLENVTTVLDCVKQYQEIDLHYISYSAAINKSIQEGYTDITDLFLNNKICLKSEKENISQLEYETMLDDEFSKNILYNFSTSMPIAHHSELDSYYLKYAKNTLQFFKNDSDSVQKILNYEIPYNKVQYFTIDSVKSSNKLALASIVKSKYLENILTDEDVFKFMDQKGHEDSKQEFIYLIQNALLEQKLNNKIPAKNIKNSGVKI